MAYPIIEHAGGREGVLMATKVYSLPGLKPCPFCGGEPVVKEGKTTFLDCRCGVVMWVDDISVAVKSWNSRALRPRKAAAHAHGSFTGKAQKRSLQARPNRQDQ